MPPQEPYTIAVIGSGPGGLSAACHAAELGASHVLLERAAQLADTIFQYQKGKLVMATPEVLPLRSPLAFTESSRETILEDWNRTANELGVNIRLNAEVVGVEGEAGDFRVLLTGGEVVRAEAVVLAVGLQGNLRKLRVPGAELPMVQYTLADPEDYEDEVIAVVGAGDSALENALALAEQNDVVLINRRGEFARAKPDNLRKVLQAIDQGELECAYHASPKLIEPGMLHLKTRDGEQPVQCDRVIARIGALPPKGFLQACGVPVPEGSSSGTPEVSETYESARAGIYIVGSLAGYPLIKQALNQGYEVVETILGHSVKPADEPLLEAKLAEVGREGVDQLLNGLMRDVPLLQGLTRLQLRDLLLESRLLAPPPGGVVFRVHDYTASFYLIAQGSCTVLAAGQSLDRTLTMLQGDFFGEMGLLSGRRRSADVWAGQDCLLVEIPRRTTLKLCHSVDAVQRSLDEAAVRRHLQTHFLSQVDEKAIVAVAELAHQSELRRFDAGAVLFNEGDAGDCLHLVRKGSVTVSQTRHGREVVVNYVQAGDYVGEMALLDDRPRSATVRAAVACETITLTAEAFHGFMERFPQVRDRVQQKVSDRVLTSTTRSEHTRSSDVIDFLVEEGVAISTDVLLIDEALCIACDNCEEACSATHHGVSRLDRAAGPTFNTTHVPTSCRHCEHPHCMADCPPNAIHRDGSGEVFIDDSCIGCGNCETNCPFDVIHMAVHDPSPQPGVLQRLFPWLFALGRKAEVGGEEKKSKVAVKCDMCREVDGGPACVHSCPTGAAIRVAPQQFFDMLREAE